MEEVVIYKVKCDGVGTYTMALFDNAEEARDYLDALKATAKVYHDTIEDYGDWFETKYPDGESAIYSIVSINIQKDIYDKLKADGNI